MYEVKALHAQFHFKVMGKPSFVTLSFGNTKIIHFCNKKKLLQKWMIFS